MKLQTKLWFTPFRSFIGLLILSIFGLFWPFFLKGKIPLPADIILGTYHPWKDVVWEGLTAGYPDKNFELSDAVTQFYPFKKEIINQIKSGKIPHWNPYVFSGTPFLADGHSGAFYPLNLIMLLPNFNLGWSLFILLQPLLATYFTYLFLKSLKLSPLSSILGSISFGFSSYFINQMEFGTIFHTALWIPLSLFAINTHHRNRTHSLLLLSFSLTMSFLAGFMQLFIYHIVFSGIYFFITVPFKKTSYLNGFWTIFLFLGLSAAQLLPWLKYMPQTSRWAGIEQEVASTSYLLEPKLLITLLAPDFFGNPVTRNWTGSQFRYYEFIFYTGCLVLPLAIISLKKDKKILFFAFMTISSLLLTLDTNPIQSLYQSKLPILPSLTPPRILGITTFCLSVLSSFGLEKILHNIKAKHLSVFIGFLAAYFWLYFYSKSFLDTNIRLTAQRNLVIPTIYAISGLFLIFVYYFSKKRIFLSGLIILTTLSLLYQGNKFNSFISPKLIFPSTKSIDYLKEHLEPNTRFISSHQEVFPVNTNMIYHLESPNGYHPVHSTSYNDFASKLQFGENDTNFGRTVFFTNPSPDIYSQTNSQYIITLDQMDQKFLSLVFTEGKTNIYQVNLPNDDKESNLNVQLKKQFFDEPFWTNLGIYISLASLTVWTTIALRTRPKLFNW